MAFQKESLDLMFVPSGLMVMFVYHLFLLYRYLKLPETTVMGFENHNKRAWVERIMEPDYKYVDTALTVISSNISAATFLCSVALTMSSLIGAWMASNTNVFQSELIYGDISASTLTMKYISLLVCFLLAFSCFVQSTRSFIHATYLISMPNTILPIYYVELAVIRGGECWQLGLRALYFALNMLMWFFGPLPMFSSSILIVLLLRHLDSNSTPLHQYPPTFTKRSSADQQVTA